MTTPVSVGYSDWDRKAAVSNILIDQFSFNSIVADRVTGPFPTGNFPALGLFLRANAGTLFTFAFFNDAAMTVTLQTQVITVDNSGNFNGFIPTLGPFVRITIHPFAFPTSVALTAYMVSTIGRPAVSSAADNKLISQTGQTVAGGALNRLNANAIYPGWAYIAVRQSAGAYVTHLEAVNYDGAIDTLMRFTDVGGPEQRTLVFLPPMPVRISHTNLDVGNHGVDLYLLGRPYVF